MHIFSLSSTISAFAVGHRRRHAEDDAQKILTERLSSATTSEFDEHMLYDIGISDVEHRRPRDERLD